MPLLGLLSAGIVALLLVGSVGIVALLSRDDLPASPQKNQRGNAGAEVASRSTDTPIPQPPSNTTPRDIPIQPDNSHLIDPDPPREAASEEPATPKRKPEPRPAPKREPAESEPPPPAAPSKPDAPAKTDVGKSDLPTREETPKGDSPPKVEASKPNSPTVLPPSSRRLSGDQIYRRLVKSSVFVMTKDSWGSGSLIHRERKLVLTNYHVVGDNREVAISFPRDDKAGKLIVEGDFYQRAYKNGEFIRGKILKVAKGQDLALVQLEKLPEGTPVLRLTAQSASPGQLVHSVGNPGASDCALVVYVGNRPAGVAQEMAVQGRAHGSDL